MQTEQTKTLVINIATGVVVIGVLVVGYVIFFKKDGASPAPLGIVTTEVANKTVVIGTQVSNTLSELENLKKSVADSAEFFTSDAFKGLRNRSASVPVEKVGRDNPFEPTVWKAKLKALEESATKKGQGASGTSQPQRAAAVGSGGSNVQTQSSMGSGGTNGTASGASAPTASEDFFL